MKLALGTVQFGLPYGIANQSGQVPRTVAKTMLQLAGDSGIDTLDTAIAYGESESCLGEVGTKGFKLVTKLPAIPEGCGDVSSWICEQVTASYARLGVESVYGLLLHRPSQLLDTGGQLIFNALQELKQAGLVQKIGVSIYAPGELDMLLPGYRFDLVQAPFNLVDRRLLTSGWLRRLKQEGVEVHTRSAFLQGLLLIPRSAIPPRFARWGGQWDRWYNWLEQHSVSAVQASLAYPLMFPEIDRVVVGADSRGQLAQIIEAAQENAINSFPDIHCEDELLINPANWSKL